MGRPRVSINEKVWLKYYETENKRFDERKKIAETEIFKLTEKVFEQYKQEWVEEVKKFPPRPTEWMRGQFNSTDPKYSWNQDEFYSQLDWS